MAIKVTRQAPVKKPVTRPKKQSPKPKTASTTKKKV